MWDKGLTQLVVLLQVRVEVLGVLDRATGLVRLRATEPIVGASQAERFTKIFEPMPIWVQRNTKIITVCYLTQNLSKKITLKIMSLSLNNFVNFRISRWTRIDFTSWATPRLCSAMCSQRGRTPQTLKSWSISKESYRKCFRYKIFLSISYLFLQTKFKIRRTNFSMLSFRILCHIWRRTWFSSFWMSSHSEKVSVSTPCFASKTWSNVWRHRYVVEIWIRFKQKPVKFCSQLATFSWLFIM